MDTAAVASATPVESTRRSTRKHSAISSAPGESSRPRKKSKVVTPAVVEALDDEDLEQDELETTPVKPPPRKSSRQSKAASVRLFSSTFSSFINFLFS